MPTEQFKDFFYPFPPIDEQEKIVAFISAETAKIDTLIAEQEKLIELLKEKRQAVIAHAVTKGLDPTVRMKDSNVDWLGEVPEFWNVIPLKYVVSMKSGDQITSENIDEVGEFPVYGGNGLRGYTKKYTHDGYYCLIGRQGALCGNINYASGQFWASEHAVVVITIKHADIFYLGELLRSMNLGQYSTSAAQPGLSVEVIGNLRVPFPPYDKQRLIAEYLKKECTKWDALIKTASQSINLFQERRSALISAAVTGQIDISNYKPKEAA
jgi:type I restriction enzyme S subunit